MNLMKLKVIVGGESDVLWSLPGRSVRFVYLDTESSPVVPESLLSRNDIPIYSKVLSRRDWYRVRRAVRYVYWLLDGIQHVLVDGGVLCVFGLPIYMPYVRLILDEYFGMDNFVNEIIWSHGGRQYAHKGWYERHRTMYVYSTNKENMFFTTEGVDYISYRARARFLFYKKKLGEDYAMINYKPGDVWHIPIPLKWTKEQRLALGTLKAYFVRPHLMYKRLLASFTQPGDICVSINERNGGFLRCVCELGRNGIALLHTDKTLPMVNVTLENIPFEILRRS